MTSWSLNCSRMSSQIGVGGSSGRADDSVSTYLEQPYKTTIRIYHCDHASASMQSPTSYPDLKPPVHQSASAPQAVIAHRRCPLWRVWMVE
jgi:hypothetical protein